MPTQWRRWTIRHMPLFVAVVAIVAVVGVVIGREAGIGRQTVASVDGVPNVEASLAALQQAQQASEMTLALSAPEICETKAARRLTSSEKVSFVRQRVVHGWGVFQEVPVSWSVSGGTAPYTLTIDGEERDATGPYEGATGVAMVGCADPSVGTFFKHFDLVVGVLRVYRDDPQLDSGWKKITAVVTDATGRQALSSLDVYVIHSLGSSGDILTRGQTYRVDGFLVTAPAAFDIRIGGLVETGCPDNAPTHQRCGGAWLEFVFVGIDAAIALWNDDYTEAKRWNRIALDADANNAGSDTVTSIDDALTLFADSVGKLPTTLRDQ